MHYDNKKRKIVKDIISDPTIVICPAVKERAIVIEDQDSYFSKMQQQLDKGDYVMDNWKEKTLPDKVALEIITSALVDEY